MGCPFPRKPVARSSRVRHTLSRGPLRLPFHVLLILLSLSPQALGATPQRTEVPRYFQRLIDAGNVEFQFYDPQTEWNLYPGRTDFLLRFQQTYSFRSQDNWQATDRYLTIWPKIRQVTSDVRHTVRLPRQYDSDTRWNSRLVKHEFDHVAISTDPRVPMLVEHLFRKVRIIHSTLTPDEKIDKPRIRRLIEAETNIRRDAVIAIVAANYRLLDKVTLHGTRPIPDRKSFFLGLYTRSNLEQMDFPYTADALDLLNGKTYRQAELLYTMDE